MSLFRCRLLLAAATVFCAAAEAEPLSINDYGSTGLWQTPSARFGEDGDFAIGIVHNKPYDRFFFTLAPLSWLEASFRYTDITNRPYSPFVEFSGNQSYKDRAVDVRAQFWNETDWLPAVALGFRDLGGTGLFGAQYLVANRRYYGVDFSLGLGWGRLGSGGPISNPLKRNVDEAKASTPGNISLSRLFASEKIGVFGGMVWDTPVEGLEAVLEYDANDYKNEPLANNQRVRTPVNVGFKYRLPYGIQAGLSYERGDTLSFNLAMLTNFGQGSGFPKLLDPAPPAPRPVTGAADSRSPEQVGKDVQTVFKQQKIGVDSLGISPDGRTASLTIATGPYRDARKTLGRSARAAAVTLPDTVASLKITEKAGGLPLYTATVNRQAVAQGAQGKITTAELDHSLRIEAPEPAAAAPQTVFRKPGPSADWSLNPSMRSQIGGPDGFFIGQLWLKAAANAVLTEGLTVGGALGVSLYDNFGSLKLQSDSTLPHVRSDIVQYLRQGRTALVRLETNYVHQLAPNFYGRLSAGIFEEMYGGVAGEVLYRPDDPRFALGLNVNRVKQRDFNQRLDFRSYEATTGNLTAYFELPHPSVLLKISAGQYLAGDRGMTVDFSREFINGVRVGVFATKTNVSAAQFGEGSFDKGFYFVLPLDLFLPTSSRSYGSFAFRPLTRDGGQMVRDGRPLYDLTHDAVSVRMPENEASFFE